MRIGTLSKLLKDIDDLKKTNEQVLPIYPIEFNLSDVDRRLFDLLALDALSIAELPYRPNYMVVRAIVHLFDLSFSQLMSDSYINGSSSSRLIHGKLDIAFGYDLLNAINRLNIQDGTPEYIIYMLPLLAAIPTPLIVRNCTISGALASYQLNSMQYDSQAALDNFKSKKLLTVAQLQHLIRYCTKIYNQRKGISWLWVTFAVLKHFAIGALSTISRRSSTHKQLFHIAEYAYYCELDEHRYVTENYTNYHHMKGLLR